MVAENFPVFFLNMSLWEQKAARTWPIWTTGWQDLWRGSLNIVITQPSINGVIVYFFAMSWVTELFHRSINMTIDWHYTMGLVSRFPVKNTHALIIMRDDDARTVRLWKETLCNNCATMVKMRHGLATLNSNNSVVYGQKQSVGTRFLS